MPGLNVHADSDNSYATTKKKWNRGPKVILAVSLLLLIPIVGTSLASQVTLNNNRGITFGQGYSAALACSGTDNVTITPNSTFNYNSGAPSSSGWQLTSLSLSGINTLDFDPYSLLGCGGKTITIQAMSGSNPLGFDIVLDLPLVAGGNTIISHNNDNYTVTNTGHSNPDTLNITLVSPVDAFSVDGFTIQES